VPCKYTKKSSAVALQVLILSVQNNTQNKLYRGSTEEARMKTGYQPGYIVYTRIFWVRVVMGRGKREFGGGVFLISDL
jgi:hypothetical protein